MTDPRRELVERVIEACLKEALTLIPRNEIGRRAQMTYKFRSLDRSQFDETAVHDEGRPVRPHRSSQTVVEPWDFKTHPLPDLNAPAQETGTPRTDALEDIPCPVDVNIWTWHTDKYRELARSLDRSQFDETAAPQSSTAEFSIAALEIPSEEEWFPEATGQGEIAVAAAPVQETGTPSKHADTLNALDEMQQSVVYAVRRQVLARAEQIIVEQERELAAAREENKAAHDALDAAAVVRGAFGYSVRYRVGILVERAEAAESRALKAESALREAEKDAWRYRWLKVYGHGTVFRKDKDMDAEIDAQVPEAIDAAPEGRGKA